MKIQFRDNDCTEIQGVYDGFGMSYVSGGKCHSDFSLWFPAFADKGEERKCTGSDEGGT